MELQDIWTEMGRLGVKKRPRKRIKELQALNQQSADSLTDAYGRLGALYFEKHAPGENEREEVKSIFENIMDLKVKNSRREDHIQRIRADFRVDELIGEINTLNQNVRNIEDMILKYQKDLKNISQRKQEIEQEKRKFEKLRGAKNRLMDAKASQ
jgi:hypothetical protein